MNLRENIDRIKEMMGINENVFLRRRINTQVLDEIFNEQLSYWISNVKGTRRTNLPPPVFANMIHVVISWVMDEIHPALIASREDFPYDEIFQSLTDRYYNQMEQAYNELFGGLQ